jgi:hypothetical protein
MQRLLTPFLPLLGLGLLAFMFFIKVDIPWEKVSVFWLMAFVFHIPLLLFFIAAVTAHPSKITFEGEPRTGRI